MPRPRFFRSSRILSGALAAALLALPMGTLSDDLPSQAPLYTLAAIPPLPGNADGFFPRAINDNGDVVGQGEMRSPRMTVSFLYKDGKTIEIKPATLQRHGGVNQSIEANAINDQGQIAGATDSSVSSSSVYHACLIDETALGNAVALPERTAPDASLPTASHAIDINQAGVCAGHVFTLNVANTACEWRRGRLVILGTLGGPESLGSGINAQEQIVGDSDLGPLQPDGTHVHHAFLWTYNGGMRDLGTLGGDYSSANCINNLGIAVGQSTLVTEARALPGKSIRAQACFWQRGKIYDLGLSPTGMGTIATGINDGGDIVGAMQTPVTKQQPYALWHACLWHKGRLYDLNDITAQDGTWGLRSANEDQGAFSPFCAYINNQGQITGYGVHNGKMEGYLLTPALPTGPRLSGVPLNKRSFRRVAAG